MWQYVTLSNSWLRFATQLKLCPPWHVGQCRFQHELYDRSRCPHLLHSRMCPPNDAVRQFMIALTTFCLSGDKLSRFELELFELVLSFLETFPYSCRNIVVTFVRFLFVVDLFIALVLLLRLVALRFIIYESIFAYRSFQLSSDSSIWGSSMELFNIT